MQYSFRADMETLLTDLNAVADKIIKLIDLFFKIGGYDPAKLEEIHKSFEFVRLIQKITKTLLKLNALPETPLHHLPR